MRILYDANAKVFVCRRCKIVIEADSTEYYVPDFTFSNGIKNDIPMCRCPKCGHGALPIQEIEDRTEVSLSGKV